MFVQKALTTRDVADLTGVPISTLNNWIARRLCRPSLLGPAGHRVTRYWHPRDVVVVQTLRTLRNAGCPFALLRRVNRLIVEEWKLDGATHSMLYDGNDILILEAGDDRMVSGGRSPGQALFPLTIHVATIPISSWLTVARNLGDEVNIEAERRARRRNQRARERRRRTVSFG